MHPLVHQFRPVSTALLVWAVFGASCPGDAAAQVEITDAGPAVEWVDLGLDPSTGQLTLVGNENGAAKVFYLSTDRTSLSSEVLVGLGPDTQVFGIASDGSRIAGVSKSPGSEDIGEGTTWLSAAPESPVGISFVDGSDPSSVAAGAWSGGVVGDHDGGQDAVTWTPTGGLVVLPDGGGLSQAIDVSLGGAVLAGFASAGPAYWDPTGFRLLPNPDGNQGRARSISPNALHIGGGLLFLDLDPFDTGTQATIWTKTATDYHLTALTNPDGSRFRGEVFDVSNSGYAVGATTGGSGFIWHPSFEAPQLIDDWLAAIADGPVLPDPSTAVVAIAEEPRTSSLFFAINTSGSAYLVRARAPIPKPHIHILEAAAEIEFVDLGLDPTTGAVTLVGTENGAAKVFYLSTDRTSLSSELLVGLGPDTQVVGIASDGSRIAGVSKSPGSVDVGEGTTWLSTAPETPVGIGFVAGFSPTSVAVGAWAGGIVGDQGGALDAVAWTPAGGLVVLPDDGGLASTFDISSDGVTAVGFSGFPSFWDTSGFHLLSNPSRNQGVALAICPNANHIGGSIDFLDFEPVFGAGTQATVWTKTPTEYHLTALTNPDGSRFKGEVFDISNSAYAVGATSEQNAFIWHPDFAAPRPLPEWLASLDSEITPPPATAIPVALAEEPDTSTLFIATASPASLIRITFPPSDLDADGLNIWQENTLGTDPSNPDTDGDGTGDGTEITLGTDPLDAASFFTATLSGPEPAPAGGLQVTITWQAVANGHYTLESSAGLDGTWLPVESRVTPTNATTQITVPLSAGATQRNFYRLRFHGIAP